MHDFKTHPELSNNQMAIYYWDSPHKQILDDFNGIVVKVTDGDTIRVKTDFRNFDFPVRFSFIQAPEMNTKEGEKSQSWLENEILGDEVLIQINPENRVGKWGRILGDIIHMGRSMNDLSLNLGYSSVFVGKER